jgi:HlyD family secretion protein
VPDAKRKTGRNIFLTIATLLLVAGGGWGYYRHRQQGVIAVQSDRVARRSLTETVVANGRIQPVLQVKISPEVSGEIIELPFKEGQPIKKGELLMRIKPDTYVANRNSAEASYRAALAGQDLAEATLKKAEVEAKRNQELLDNHLISESVCLEFRTAAEVAQASFQSAMHQVAVAKGALARADEDLAKTTIASPLTGTVSKLNSQLGERVVGTAMMTGTEVMVVSDLEEMEARVDIGEIDVVLIEAGQFARLEVDAFRDRKFSGAVTEIANSSKTAGQPATGGGGGGQQQEATKFEVKIRINEKELFRPGMSVTAEIETRSRTNVLVVPIASVTTRLPPEAKEAAKSAEKLDRRKDSSVDDPQAARADKAPKPIELVFVVEGETVKGVPVKRGISDDSFTEILAGLQEGQEVVSGGYKAISRELETGKKIKKSAPEKDRK